MYEERLTFGPGLSDPDAPDLLATDLTGVTTLMARVGEADPAKVQRAADQNPRARIVGRSPWLATRERSEAACPGALGRPSGGIVE
jgi:uncharacterized protein YaeQ